MIALAGLRAHAPRLLATLLAVAAGVGLVGAALLVAESARAEVPTRVTGATALVVAPDPAVDRSDDAGAPLPWSPGEADALSARLATLPGVGAVVADRSFYAQVLPGGQPALAPHDSDRPHDSDDDAGGHGWSGVALGPHRLVDGVAPRAPGDVVVDRALGLPVGATVPVALGAERQERRVSGLLDGPGVYVDDAEARVLSPGVQAVGVLAASDPSRVAARVAEEVGTSGQVLVGDDRSRVEPTWMARQRFLGSQVIAALVVITVATTVLVVAATVALAVAGRRRELALLRVIGATPRALRRIVLGEALAVGLAGGVVGCLLALGLAPALAALLTTLGAAPLGLAPRVAWWPLPVALGIGVLISVLGGWSASRSVSRVGPLEALAEAATEQRAMPRGRVVAGALALGCGLLLAAGAAVTDGDGRSGYGLGAALALIAAGSLLAPAVLAPIGRALAACVSRRSPAVLLGAELAGAPRRAASTAAPVIATVGIVVLLSGMVNAMAVAYPAEQADWVAGRTVVVADGVPGLGDGAVAAVGAPPGTRAALPSRVVVPGPSGPTAVDAVGSLDVDLVGPGQAVLTDQLASALDLRPGDLLPVRFVDGTTLPLRVSRVLPLDPVRGLVGLAVDRTTVHAHDPSALTEAVFLPPGTSPRAVPAGAVVRDAEAWARADYETDDRVSRALVLLVVVVSVGFTGLAIAGGMALAARGRRADLRVLAALGATRRRLLALVADETTLTVLVASALGVVAAVPPLVAVGAGLAEATDADVGLHLDPAVTAIAVAGCLVVALTAALVVTARGLHSGAITETVGK